MTQKTKQTVVSSFFAVGCVLLYFFYPVTDSRFEIIVATVIFLLALPIVYHRVIIRRTWEDLAITHFYIERREQFLVVSSIIVGSLCAFLLVSVDLGTQQYMQNLSPAIMQSYKAFVVYELFFVSIWLFLFSFFAWGFVRSIAWDKELYAHIFATAIFGVLIMDFYNSFFITVPFIIPTLFLLKTEKRINPIYIFIACYTINLVLDTIIIKSFVSSL